MNPNRIKYCPCTLQTGYATYSPNGQQLLFGSRSKRVSHIIPFGATDKNIPIPRTINEKRIHISISGVQEKLSLTEHRNKLTVSDSPGTHILKPVPADRFDLINDLPANEHLTMQIARQVFGIKTAACGMIFLGDGTPAYITRRFDYKPDGISKYQVEDLASLLAKSPEREGDNHKYNASYLDIAKAIHQFVAAAPIALIEFFRLVVFNYIVGNGDAHLKNFSLMETDDGDYFLSPAYDLLCTALHINDGSLALSNGLYNGDHEEDSFQVFGFYTNASFIKFAEKAGIEPKLAAGIIRQMIRSAPEAYTFVERSFMSKEAKKKYSHHLQIRLQNLSAK